MEKHLFLGDEAIAQAAIDAGISGVYAYPGTPSTEITEYIQDNTLARERNIFCRWCTNELSIVAGARMRKPPWKPLWVCAMPVNVRFAA